MNKNLAKTRNSNLTRRQPRSINKIGALNKNIHKHNNPKVVFLDTNDIVDNKKEELDAIEMERERISKEQANIISIIPATQYNTQNLSNDMPPAEQSTQQNNNSTTLAIHQSTQKPSNEKPPLTTTKADNNQLQIERTTETKVQYSITRSTTSQDYHTPPVSTWIDETSDPNTEELQELSERP